MKKTITLSMVLVLTTAASAQTWFKGTLDQAMAKAKTENKLVLVDFYSAGWGACKLLGQQFYSNPKFQPFLDKNFVLYRADSAEEVGDQTFKKFNIHATPTLLFLGPDGAEIDWVVGYGPPPEKFQDKLAKILAGGETFKDLSAAYAKNPKDAATVFKLARKWGDRYDDTKTLPLYKEVIALDPQGKSGMYTNEYTKVTVPYTEFAALQVAAQGMNGQKPDLRPLRDFMVKYPKSPLMKDAYSRMSNYYGYQAPKEEAAKFFAEYAGKFPEDATVLSSWLNRIVRDKEPLDKGVELAEKIKTLARSTPTSTYQGIADLYLLKGDKDKAEEAFGKNFMENRVASLAYDLIAYADFWLEKGENKDSALAMAETALKLEPDNSYFIQQASGAYLKMNKDDKSLALFGPAYMQKNINDASALNSYAWFWAGQGKNLQSALTAAKKAVELKPKQYFIWDTLGAVYAKMKNTTEAIKAMEKAIDLAPDNLKEAYKKRLEKIKADAEKK